MQKFLPEMYDSPEKKTVAAGISYGAFCFYLFPFLMMMLSIGTTSASTLSWIEIVYHAFNFLIALWMFFSYLKESFFNVRYQTKHFLLVSAGCAAACILYGISVTFQGARATEDIHHFIAQSALPLIEVEQFNLTTNLVCVNPIYGTVCAVFFAPVTISCLYYATAFAPVCTSRPWLAYVMVAVITAVPRVCGALTFWPFEEELILYLVQLPLHMIACVAYQKTDTIWAPIAVHMITNAVACVAVFAVFGIG